MRRALGPGFRPVGIRPPYGHVTDAVKELAARYRMPLILWGLDSQDAVCTKENEDKTLRVLLAQANFEVLRANLGSGLAGWHLQRTTNAQDNCVDEILQNYKSYLRPGTIILHHAH